MKKTIQLILVFIITMTTDGICQNRSITFIDKPFADILAMSRQEHKMVFMDAYTSWCGPCKWMSAHMFTNDTVADFYNKNFICARYDMEKGEGPKLSQQYRVRAFPTLLFINQDGNMVHLRVGAAQSAPEYISLALNAMDTTECFTAYMKRYSTGENSPGFIYNYLKRLTDAYLPADVPLNKYLSGQKESDLIKNDNWKIIFSFCNNMESREFKFLLARQDEFARVHGRDSVNTKIYNVYFKAIIDLARGVKMSDSAYNAIIHKIHASGYTDANRLIFDASFNVYQMQGNLVKLMELSYNEVDTYYHDDPGMLNEVANMMLSLSTENKYLEKASQWAKRSVELKPDVANNETSAALFYKLGKKDEAVKYCKNALIIAKKQNLPAETIEENLKKYESGK